MTLVIRRPVGVLVGLAAAALLLSACGSGPNQVGSALIVGNTSVSVNQVQKELNGLLASSPTVQQAQKQGKLDQATAGIVTNHVLHDLVGRSATENQLVVTDQQVDQLISQSGGAAKLAPALEVDQANVRTTVKDVLLEVALARKFADSLSVNFGYVVATSRADATAKAQQLAANPNGLAAMVAAANKTAQAQGAQSGGQTTATFSVSSYLQGVEQAQQQAQSQGTAAPTENDGPVFGTPVNTVVAFEPDPASSGTWIVALIKSRTINTSTVPLGASPADNADLSTLEQIGISLLQPDAKSLGVRVSPRYGVWDQVGMEVVPSTAQPTGLEIPVAHKS